MLYLINQLTKKKPGPGLGVLWLPGAGVVLLKLPHKLELNL